MCCARRLHRPGDPRGDDWVPVGGASLLRVPVGKLHNDRYVPLHPQLKRCSIPGWRTVLTGCARTWSSCPGVAARVDRAVARLAATAGIGKVTAHQLRHTLATQAINRGMSLEAIAALLGHRTMTMTIV